MVPVGTWHRLARTLLRNGTSWYLTQSGTDIFTKWYQFVPGTNWHGHFYEMVPVGTWHILARTLLRNGTSWYLTQTGTDIVTKWYHLVPDTYWHGHCYERYQL